MKNPFPGKVEAFVNEEFNLHGIIVRAEYALPVKDRDRLELSEEQATYIRDAINNREALEDRNAKLVAMLKETEWASMDAETGEQSRCPMCYASDWPSKQHCPSCKLAALLAEEKD